MQYGTPLSAFDRERLRTLVARDGERGALARTKLSRWTLARALAGLPLYAGSHAAIRGALERLEAEAARAPDGYLSAGAYPDGILKSD